MNANATTAIHAANIAATAELLAVRAIQPSPTNPRKHFDEAALKELADSVARHGVLQPILVRAGSSPKDPRILWEVVAGERRWRAAQIAGIETIPAVVRALTDVEALELQVIENLQRADLHPLEEAEGYEQLMKLHAYTVDDLAAKVGKSRAYIYARLKLCALTAKGREAFYAGQLNPSTALLVARISPAKMQDEAVKELTTPDYRGDLMSVRQAAETIQRGYMLRLKDAPFKTDDAKLIAKAGACGPCAKRTGNHPELFADVASADVCTDKVCFVAKRDAHLAQLRAAAEKKGLTVIHGADAKALKKNSYNEIGGGYVQLTDTCWEDPERRSYKAVLGKDAVAVTLMFEDPFEHKLVPVAKKADVDKLVAAALPRDRSAEKAGPATRADPPAARYRNQIQLAILRAIFDAPLDKISKEDLVAIAGEMLENGFGDDSAVLALCGAPNEGDITGDEARAWLQTLGALEITRVMLLAAIGTNYSNELRTAAAERRGLDVKAIEKQAIADAKATEKAAAEAAKEPKAKKVKA